MRSTLTRRVVFAAAHRYSRPDWSDEENRRVFGLCAMPNYHGHNYSCEVTITGEIDPRTGGVVDLGKLDDILCSEITERFDHRNINIEVPEFADGKLIPTGENLARFIFDRVQSRLGASARVSCVVVAEDENLKSAYSDE